MTPSSAAISRKRKQPPTFQHLPLERAKKLKKDWVEKKKIKSKWRHEKQKDGLGHTSQPPAQEDSAYRPTSVPETQDRSESEDSEDIADSKKSTTRDEAPRPEVKEKPPPKRQLKPVRSSQSSLRTKTEEPRGSHGGPLNNRGRGRGRGTAARGRASTIRGRGRQPDMRVKMGDLLEKIQKTHGSG